MGQLVSDDRPFERNVLGALERFGPLSLQQIYIILNMEPSFAARITDSLYDRCLVEMVDEPFPDGLPEDMTKVYGLPTGRGRTNKIRASK